MSMHWLIGDQVGCVASLCRGRSCASYAQASCPGGMHCAGLGSVCNTSPAFVCCFLLPQEQDTEQPRVEGEMKVEDAES